MGRLTGIVLAGGKSTRMGTDKAFIRQNNKPLYQIAAEKLQIFCDEVHISINKNQLEKHSFEYPIVIDTYEAQGPLGGLISAYNQLNPPFLLMATDMICVEAQHIGTLTEAFKSKQKSIMYFNTSTGYFEPMLSIWHVDTLENLCLYFEKGGRSFQQFLKKSEDIYTVACDDCRFLHNANTPDSLEY